MNLTHRIAEGNAGIIGGDIEAHHRHAHGAGVGDLRVGGQSGRLYNLKLSLLRENEKVGSGEERQTSQETRGDVDLDRRSAAHKTHVVHFDESLTEQLIVGTGARGRKSHRRQGGTVDVEVRQRARMNLKNEMEGN